MIQQSMQKRCIHSILLLITKVCIIMVVIVIYLLTVKKLLNAISNDKIHDINAYLMKKNGII